MILSSRTQSTLLRHQHAIDTALRAILAKVAATTQVPALDDYYGQMRYHLGWVDTTLTPIHSNAGKLLRPTLLLLAYEVAGAWDYTETDVSRSAYLQRALPAAVAVELTHNFTLIHDDIEDGDTERRHRPTLWNVWGVPQAINSGDGMYALSRLALWDVLEQGVESQLAVRLGALLDRTLLAIAEGQYLDISFETRLDISVAMYLDMIKRKTAALLSCSAEMGALLGTSDQETVACLKSFGQVVGVAFQVRDDILGVWATSAELGKTATGDIYRRKKSLPILHALEHADLQQQEVLRTIYQQEAPINQEQVEEVLNIFEETQTRAYCRDFLAHQCQLAHQMLASVPTVATPLSARASDDMETIIQFIEETVR